MQSSGTVDNIEEGARISTGENCEQSGVESRNKQKYMWRRCCVKQCSFKSTRRMLIRLILFWSNVLFTCPNHLSLSSNNPSRMLGEFKKGWFTETGVLNSNQVNVSIKINQILHERKSQFQKITVFKNDVFGTCLVLDDAIQCTELDECSYQEMISFLPLNIHPNPKRVLIIGGGDGGVAREVNKHPLVEEIVQCEIDQDVVEVSKEYLPFMAVGFQSPKLKLHFADGYKYVLDHKNEFDVIITDSSDPKGPAVSLYQSEYYQALYESLRPNGVICCQAESYWFDLPFIKSIYSKVGKIFPSVSYASIAVASYPSGQIGFLIASKDPNVDFKENQHQLSKEEEAKMNFKYYTTEMHRAAFTLPPLVEKELKTAMTEL